MPGTRPTSTRSSEEHEMLLSRVGLFMQPAFVGPRLVAFGKIRTRSFDQRHASAGEFPASTREGRTFKMTRAHRLTVERKRHGTHLPYRKRTLARENAGPICATHLAPVGLEEVALQVSRSSSKCQHIHQPKLIKAMQQLSPFLSHKLIGFFCPNSRPLMVEAACHIWLYLVLTVCIGNLPPFAPQNPRSPSPTG